MSRHRIAIGRDLVGKEGKPDFPGYSLLPAAAMARLEFVDVPIDGKLRGGDLAGCEILISTPMAADITRDSLPRDGRLAAILRLGVGYEDVDVAACTDQDVALVIPPDAVRRGTAVAALTLILAVTTRLIDKHRLTLAGPERWADRPKLRGVGLVGRTLGLLGLGNIGAELARLAQPLDVKIIAHDPYIDPASAAALSVRPVDLDTLFREADILSIHCPQNAATRGLVDARRLGLMKPTAYLINTARGGIVDQGALADALRRRRIAGAGLDVFDREPPDPADPLLALDNVVLSAHALNWTDQVDDLFAQAIAGQLQDLLRGQEPRTVANPQVLARPGWRKKLAGLAAGSDDRPERQRRS